MIHTTCGNNSVVLKITSGLEVFTNTIGIYPDKITIGDGEIIFTKHKIPTEFMCIYCLEYVSFNEIEFTCYKCATKITGNNVKILDKYGGTYCREHAREISKEKKVDIKLLSELFEEGILIERFERYR